MCHRAATRASSTSSAPRTPRFVTQIIALARCPGRKTESSKAATISIGPTRTVETSRVGSSEAPVVLVPGGGPTLRPYQVDYE